MQGKLQRRGDRGSHAQADGSLGLPARRSSVEFGGAVLRSACWLARPPGARERGVYRKSSQVTAIPSVVPPTPEECVLMPSVCVETCASFTWDAREINRAPSAISLIDGKGMHSANKRD